MTLENKLLSLKEIVPKILFYIKNDGEDFCEGKLKRELCDGDICLKARYNHKKLDCKYFKLNTEYLHLSNCVYPITKSQVINKK